VTSFRQAAGFSVRGARHLQNGSPCQDAVYLVEDEELLVVCTADGHGDKKHARSDEGSKIAVEVAAELLESAARALQSEPHRQPKEVTSSLRMHLPRRISWEWNRRIKNLAGLGDDGEWHKDLVLFGTTVMGAAITDEFGLFVQLGDGDMMLVERSGTMSLVFPPDEEMYGTATHSLCQPNNAQNAQVEFRLLREPRFLLLSTDGLRDSLQGDEEAYFGVGRWLLQRLKREGWSKVAASMPDWLSELSHRGNGDDATVGMVRWGAERPEKQETETEDGTS
jgi:serine/threonine protein phosphatase PrpC